MDINEFLDYESKSIAEFRVAIYEIEEQIKQCIKEKNFLKAFKLEKLKLKLVSLLSKKTTQGAKHGYDNNQKHKRGKN